MVTILGEDDPVKGVITIVPVFVVEAQFHSTEYTLPNDVIKMT